MRLLQMAAPKFLDKNGRPLESGRKYNVRVGEHLSIVEVFYDEPGELTARFIRDDSLESVASIFAKLPEAVWLPIGGDE